MAKDPTPQDDKPSKGAVIGKLLDAFEASAKADGDGVQYWFARDLAPLLGYSEYRNFSNVIAKAVQSCSQANEDAADHFVDVNKMVTLGSGAERAIDDVELTRFACYLIAQNGDPSKPEIAAAQMYFTIATSAGLSGSNSTASFAMSRRSFSHASRERPLAEASAGTATATAGEGC